MLVYRYCNNATFIPYLGVNCQAIDLVNLCAYLSCICNQFRLNEISKFRLEFFVFSSLIKSTIFDFQTSISPHSLNLKNQFPWASVQRILVILWSLMKIITPVHFWHFFFSIIWKSLFWTYHVLEKCPSNPNRSTLSPYQKFSL